jgi:hypothetical protein
MIYALRYEPRGQRQRFEPEIEIQQREEQDRHIHLHFHLNLTYRVRQGRSTSLNASRVKSILTALVAATVIPLWLLPWAIFPSDGPPSPAWENMLVVWSFVSMVAGLVLAWIAIGTLLRQVWRANPRERRGLVLPFAFLLLIVLLTTAFFWLPNPGLLSGLMMLLGAVPFMGVLLAHPLFTALLLGRVSREARALSQQAPTHRKLGFVAVAGMVLLLFGGLLFNVAILLGGGIAQMILFLPATCMAIIVAMRPNARLFRSPVRMQARPKDASPFDVGSFRERGYHPVDRNQKEKRQGETE